MNEQDLLAGVMAELTSIAPEVDPAGLTRTRLLREQVDLDSMDWLNFLIGLHRRFKIDIPESDYGKLRTLDDLTGYLGARLA
ncbi:phosphopantetheine-binding protein [Massilia sp. WF1]|jgi:acyl carrier protein|uniref:acyl carrier protein n=1 Tax=unclassified Massilia TaxID=2609279 RepID=UPI000649C0B4|nr:MULTISPECIES: acyl carrier protein [unclassified Massilia]ALK98136.1 phosphopantetheine-binding protein [Massilia sp. WG5]KLU35609.1 phosphopantetheine-binding protein [Massilia sp. WF1]